MWRPVVDIHAKILDALPRGVARLKSLVDADLGDGLINYEGRSERHDALPAGAVEFQTNDFERLVTLDALPDRDVPASKRSLSVLSKGLG